MDGDPAASRVADRGEPAAARGELVSVASDDAELVRASLHDPARFVAIFEAHHTRIWRFLARLAGRGAADDLAGDVFLAAFRHRARYDPSKGSVQSWLYGIAVNLARDRARRDARATRAISRLAADRAVSAPPDALVVDTLSLDGELDHVRRALAQLSEPHREVLVLYAWEDLSYESIAAALGVRVGTVRSRLARARRHLRELVGRSDESLDGTAVVRRDATDG